MKKKDNLILTNVTRVLSANFLVAFVGFLGSFIFPKILTIDAYALYHTFTLYVGYIGILHLGFPSGMVINYAGKKHDLIDKKQYKSELILLIVILSFFTTVFLAIWIRTNNIMVLYIALAVIPVGIINSYRALYQSWMLFKKYTRYSVFISVSIPLLALTYYLKNNILPGYIYIIIYLFIYWIISIIFLLSECKFVEGKKPNKIFSKQNFCTEKIGLSLVIGNYINTLFVSADKQFVKWFFGTTEFAFYSFGMSMQALMTVFITSISQPLFPSMAQGIFSNNDYNRIKKLLFIFGSFSGCAYFALSFIVKHFIQKYIGSLEIIGVYFIVFPAMGVINCLYINLYKIKGKMKMYVITLFSILCTAILLNLFFVMSINHYTGVAIATTITYYVWLFMGSLQFKFLKFDFYDLEFLLFYIVGFIAITRFFEDILGFCIYLLFVILLISIIYRNECRFCINKIFKKNKI